MKTVTRLGPWAGILLAILALSAPARQSFGGKPAPLPPVRYQIQYWDTPNPSGTAIPMSMNNLGQVVGWYNDATGQQRAYLYDPALHPSLALDLGDLVLEAGVPDGWKIASANAMNTHGVIVGSLAPIAPSSDRQAFVLDLGAATPTVVPLPNWGGWGYFSANQINDHGDIVGTYQNADGSYGKFFYNPIVSATPFDLPGAGATSVGGRGFLNNQGQVGGNLNDANFTPYRWDPLLGTLQTFPGLANATVFGINDLGTLCGQVDVTTTSGTGKNKTTTTKPYPMRLQALPPNILSGAPGNNAHAINATADVLISNGSIYRDDWTTYGSYVDINKLVVGTSTDVTTWNTSIGKTWWYMNDRGSVSNAGQIMGQVHFSTTSGVNFLLIPVATP